MSITFGDTVKILHSPETDAIGLSGKTGQVYGITTPSVTSVEVIGHLANDFAVNVSIEGFEEQYWFVEELLEFVDHGAGTEIVVGNHRAIRQIDGSWEELEESPKKKRWQL